MNSAPPQLINAAFWNLQNLFDPETSPIAADLDFTSVNGWNRRAFECKTANVAEVIRQMFDGAGPDLLGICEIENSRAAEHLLEAVGRDDLAVARAEHPDIRGLDTALIYSTRIFEVSEPETRGHQVHLRYPTCDILEVRLKIRQNDADLAVLVNHWPSRKPDRAQTEALRLTAADHCRQLVNQIVRLPRRDYLQLADTELSCAEVNSVWDRNVLVMGDFNDEPWDRSVLEVLGAACSVKQLESPVQPSGGSLPSYRSYAAATACLFNPMWSLAGTPDVGTVCFPGSGRTMHLTDQFLLSRGLFFGLNGLQPESGADGIPSVEIFRPDCMTTEHASPRQFRCDSRTGYSDHFPITMALQISDP